MNSLVVGFSKLLDNDLTTSQYFILQMLASENMYTSSEIASALDVTLSAVTNLSNKLVRKGYVERIPSQTDRRSIYLKITEQGLNVNAQMLERYKELTDGLGFDFSEQEVDLLIASYERMIERLQQNNQ
ncbi:DNA-binding transcriptional regulator, MarR family [Paenibacillus uliginis N3/975]|uniref:DNA-binding transcriptional regulator, MarR family n=1 Tax=Paenibacillus uliginis N3/975 TaxID=1313296 RepID=A0A1X7G7B8_9BACL|nr:MarR family transcriptional regulator [Paenibacillus uliginis]SMF65225.1 DNA-binding transcriptional regulator, MarR family [Paenibacillus uliginis N3/975]